MSASNLDKILKVGKPGTATTLAAPGHTSGGTSITVASTTNWPTETAVAFAMDVVTVAGDESTRVAGTYTEWIGVVTSATTIGSLTLSSDSPNSDQNYAAGSLTRVYIPVTATRENKLAEAVLIHSDQDGTLKAGAVDNVGVFASGVISATAPFDTSLNPQTRYSDDFFDHVASDCVLTGTGYGSTLAWSLTSGVVYIGGKRLTVAAATGTVTASKDTYFDLLDPGSGTVATLVYTGGNEVANNAASPALAANSVRLAIIQSGANIASVASINQGQETKVVPIASSVPYAVTDSLGNLICPRDPNRRILGFRQITADFTTTAVATDTDVTGLSVPVIVPTGRRLKMSVYGYNIKSSQAPGNDMIITIKDGTTPITSSRQHTPVSNYFVSANTSAVITPTAGSHTYKVTVNQGAAGTLTFSATATAPAYILAELA